MDYATARPLIRSGDVILRFGGVDVRGRYPDGNAVFDHRPHGAGERIAQAK